MKKAYKRFNKIHYKACCIYCSLFGHFLSEDEMTSEMIEFCDGYLMAKIGNDWQSLAMVKQWIKEGRPCLA